MKTKPEVSIIIPTFNEEKYIGACLASIKRQNFSRPYEVIIGDGGSKDGTVQIARDYGAKVVPENYGTPSGGRQAAAKAAKGKYLFFVSADVELAQGYLENMHKAFASGKATWAVGAIKPLGGNFIEEAGAVILNAFAHVLNAIGVAYVNADTLSARADSYWKAGGFNPKLVTAEDTDLGTRLMKTGRFAFAGKAVAMLSMRRVRKWGYFKFTVFHTINFFKTHLFSSSAERYDPVR
jgi:glycosyltransferase involved in cell wall biosynthesis